MRYLARPVVRAMSALGFRVGIRDGIFLENLDECPGASDKAIFGAAVYVDVRKVFLRNLEDELKGVVFVAILERDESLTSGIAFGLAAESFDAYGGVRFC